MKARQNEHQKIRGRFTARTIIALLGCILALVFGFTSCDDSRSDPTSMAIGNSQHGRLIMHNYGCDSCHSIPGVQGAEGLVGPPLDRMAQRVYIGGVLANTPDNMIRWLRNPQEVDKLTAMPNVGLTDEDAHDIASYLYTLK
jgi:cytochrome c1